MPDIYVAKHGFTHTSTQGGKVIVYEGDTVEDGHWLLTSVPDSFRPLEVKYPASVPKKAAPVVPAAAVTTGS